VAGFGRLVQAEPVAQDRRQAVAIGQRPAVLGGQQAQGRGGFESDGVPGPAQHGGVAEGVAQHHRS
jgi:hypothetical protein